MAGGKTLPIAARRLNEYLQDYFKENHMNNLENQIKELIIDSLGLEDITPADIGSEDPSSAMKAWV